MDEDSMKTIKEILHTADGIQDVPMPTGVDMALLIRIYNTGYKAGHHYTVEGGYADIFECDMETYHAEEVEEMVEEFADGGN